MRDEPAEAPPADGFFLGPTGQVSVPRAMRWIFVKDKRALGAAFERLAATPNLERVTFGHGRPVTGADAAACLRAVAIQPRVGRVTSRRREP